MSISYLRVVGILKPTYVSPNGGFTHTLDNARMFWDEDGDLDLSVSKILQDYECMLPPVYIRAVTL